MTNYRLLKYWQNKLNLNDWSIIVIDNCKPNDMNIEGVAGECEYNEVLKNAVIRMLDKKYITYNTYSYEKTLLHELLHCKFCLLDDTDNQLQNRIVHQLIEEFSKIICGLSHDT